MKIGVLTYWWSEDNYGQLLQCYALQKYLVEAGHESFLIRYDSRNDYPKLPQWRRVLKAMNPKALSSFIQIKIHDKIIEKEQLDNTRCFSLFREIYLNKTDIIYRSYEELKKNPPQADVYIVGSDQVWNYKTYPARGKNNVLRAYMLDFGPECVKRISYAASWGMSQIEESRIPEINRLLSKFAYISVREQSGVEICKKCGIAQNVDWVADPTMLLDAGIYRNLYVENDVRKPSSPYVLLYMLNNKHNFRIQKIYDFAKSKGLNVVYVTGNGVVDKRKKFFATIPEWLYLVDNAEYVVTNSFHCSVFSLIFHKQFAVVPLSGKHSEMNARFDSLFNLWKIDRRYVSNDDLSALNHVYHTEFKPTAGNLLKAIKN